MLLEEEKNRTRKSKYAVEDGSHIIQAGYDEFATYVQEQLGKFH